ncbi:hypothetical protein BS47DRAFT_1368947 [Hydnum rufescens UP504]|uniref:Uncharacterized protein n=1 Tax=Hydnum rufescens UP504 TaxID=1448309 RepID=A0A9P6DMF7_9AGAM|nr:hypothetical protein BS47DRAFT_1368947 [Hydnum rufescens UP504]
MSRLWHARVLRQKLDGKIATLKEILDPSMTDDQLAGEGPPAQGDLGAIVAHLEAAFEHSVVPQLVNFYKQQEVDKILGQDKSLVASHQIGQASRWASGLPGAFHNRQI